MSILTKVIKEQKEDIDPASITAGDVSTYVRHVKRELKGKTVTKNAVASVVHDMIEDDPKFGANPGIAKQLITKVFAKLTESAQLNELSNDLVGRYADRAHDEMTGRAGDHDFHHNLSQKHFKHAEEFNGKDKDMWQAHSTIATYHAHKAAEHANKFSKRADGMDRANKRFEDNSGKVSEAVSTRYSSMTGTHNTKLSEIDWQHFRLELFVSKYGTNKTAAAIQSAYDNDKLSKVAATRLLDRLTQLHPNDRKFVLESWDDEDDEDPDVKIAAKEAKKSGAKLLSKKAEDALSKKLSKADKSSEDASSKKLDEDMSLDVDEMTVSELRNKFLAATKKAHPAVIGLVVKSDGKELRCEVPGEDRCYSVMPLDTGKIKILGESWDDEDDEDDEDPDVKIAAKEAKKSGVKLLSKKAEAALQGKLSKADKKQEDESAKKVEESRKGLIAYLGLSMVSEEMNQHGERMQYTYAGWKRAVKAKHPDAWFDGDKEICNAMVGPNPYVRYKTKGVGEWDGEKGSVYK